MHRGYIKLWRKSFDSPMWKNQKLWRFWTYCLLKASHKKNIQIIGFQEVEILPGQFIFGRSQASKETGLSEQTIRTCLKKLEQNQKKVALKTTNKFTIISIINWELYQDTEKKNNQQVTSKQPASNHIQECKECKEYKIKRLCPACFPCEDIKEQFKKYTDSKKWHGDHEQFIEGFLIGNTKNGKKWNNWYSALQGWLRKDIEWNGLPQISAADETEQNLREHGL